jgi:preprotein translocase subunit YajC
MYKTFELLQKAIYIICFWSLVFYILEIRKYDVSALGIAIETLIGWLIFLTIIVLFVMFVSSSHRQTKDTTKEKITKNVVEDGMVFTVGGHTKILPVLPEAYLIESEILNKYEEDNPSIESSKKSLSSLQAVCLRKYWIIQMRPQSHFPKKTCLKPMKVGPKSTMKIKETRLIPLITSPMLKFRKKPIRALKQFPANSPMTRESKNR